MLPCVSKVTPNSRSCPIDEIGNVTGPPAGAPPEPPAPVVPAEPVVPAPPVVPTLPASPVVPALPPLPVVPAMPVPPPEPPFPVDCPPSDEHAPPSASDARAATIHFVPAVSNLDLMFGLPFEIRLQSLLNVKIPI